MKKKKRDYEMFDEVSENTNEFESLGWDMPEIDELPEDFDLEENLGEEPLDVDENQAEDETDYTEPQYDEEEEQLRFDTAEIDSYSTADEKQDFSDAPAVLSITSSMAIPDDILSEAARMVVPKTEEIQIPDDIMESVEALKKAAAEKQPQMASVDDIPTEHELPEEEENLDPAEIFTVNGNFTPADEAPSEPETDAAENAEYDSNEEINDWAEDETSADEDYSAEDNIDYNADTVGEDDIPEYDPDEYEEKPEKQGFFSRLFGKKKKKSEDNVYGDLKRKDIGELQQDYNPTGEVSMLDDTYSKLFDDSVDSLDEEVSESFNQIQRERRRRVAQAIENTGVDLDVMEDEFGIVAPPPITVMAADPSAQDSNAVKTGNDAADSFNKSLMDQEKSRTMEIKLNVLNDTMEIQKLLNLPELDSDSASKIEEEARIYQTAEIELPDNLNDYEDDDMEAEDEEIVEGFPSIEDVRRYRPRTLPVHCIDLEALQEALNAEAEDYDAETGTYRGRQLNTNQADGIFEGVKEAHTDDSEEKSYDYTSPEEAKRVSDGLKADMAKLNLKTMITGFSAAVLLIAGLIFEGRNNSTMSVIYLILSLVLTCTAGFFCKDEIINGIKTIIKFRANADAAAAVAVVAVLVQIFASFAAVGRVSRGNVHIYGALAVGILFMNAMGKLSLTRRVFANFRFMTSRDEKYAVRTYDDYNTSLKLAGETAMGTPVIVYQRKAGFLKRYLELSHKPDPSQQASEIIAPYALVLSLVIGLITIITTKSPVLGVSAVAAVACGATIVTNTLGINSLLTKLSRKARKAGAMISGYEGIKQLSDANAVMVGESDLFPKGSVTINGLKIFSDEAIEENVLAASSLIRETGGTVADVFEQIITDTGAEVPKITNIVLEGENGVSGKVGEKHVLVGNRDILISHNITPPEREDIMKYLKGGKKALFIAVDDELKAMLVLTYNADKRRKLELQKLTESGVTLIVHSIDSNITTSFLSTIFDIPEAKINVVHGDLGMSSRELAESEITRADAAAATKGRIESLLSVMTMCIKERKMANLVVLIQYLGVILGVLITAVISIATGHAISAFLLVLFEIIWSAIVLLVPKFLNK